MDRMIQVDTPVNPNAVAYDILVIDRSGSMQYQWSSLTTGIDTYITDLAQTRQQTGVPVFSTVIVFDSSVEILFDFTPIEEVIPFSQMNIAPRGMTALNDAVMTAIEMLKAKIGPENLNSPDIGVNITIYTDGYENSSIRYPGAGNLEVSGYIRELQNTYHWTIAYVGAGSVEEVQQTAQDLGIPTSNIMAYSVSWDSGSENTRAMSVARRRSLTRMSAGVSQQELSASYFSAPAQPANLHSEYLRTAINVGESQNTTNLSAPPPPQTDNTTTNSV